MEKEVREPTAIVAPPGKGLQFGNIEFLARTDDTSKFNLAIISLDARSNGPPALVHDNEDDAFFMLSGELDFDADGRTIHATPETFVLIPPGARHSFANNTDRLARFLNIHAPAGFDRRIMGLDEP